MNTSVLNKLCYIAAVLLFSVLMLYPTVSGLVYAIESKYINGVEELMWWLVLFVVLFACAVFSTKGYQVIFKKKAEK